MAKIEALEFTYDLEADLAAQARTSMSIAHSSGSKSITTAVVYPEARGGLFHTGSMHIVEKLTRVGNELHYDMTIEDPEAFIEPWVMPTRVLRLEERADGGVMAERANCEVYEEDNVSSQVRH